MWPPRFPGMADGAGAGAAKRKADEGAEELRVRTMYEGLWARILTFETFRHPVDRPQRSSKGGSFI